ncbi:MAG: hypothetical protein HC912_02715 [Saprospiraceae bacterium]|nr:hypothetical protein [Saprospiraceae bacterium]
MNCTQNDLRSSETPKSTLDTGFIKYEDYGLQKYYFVQLSSLGVLGRKGIEFLTSFSTTKESMYDYPTLYTGSGTLIWDKTNCAIYDNQDNANTRKINYKISKY